MGVPLDAIQSVQCRPNVAEAVLWGLPFTFCCLDDVLVASPYPTFHKEHLCTVFEWLDAHGLIIHREKCTFGQAYITFLEHGMNVDSIAPSWPRWMLSGMSPPPAKHAWALFKFFSMINHYD